MQAHSNSRASLLSGLRTGGVRSASQPSIVPHTAAVGGSFNVPRFASYTSQPSFEDDEADELVDMVNYNMSLNAGHRMMHQQPVTASAADGVGNRFQQQQQQAFMRQMGAQRGNTNGMANMDSVQLQMMQMELMKLQAIQQAQQVQQFQAELLAQAQRQQQAQSHSQRVPSGRRGSAFNEPATAGPTNMSFDIRGAPQNSRSNFPDVYGHEEVQQVPMTAALGGKFGGRPVLSALNPNASVFTLRGDLDEPGTPKTPTATTHGRTTVISGGTSLGAPSGAPSGASPAPSPTVSTPTKSDSATSWRRGPSAGNAPVRPAGSSPSIKLTPPAGDAGSAPSPLKSRPSPLRFSDDGHAAFGSSHVDVESGTESDADSYVSDLAQLTGASVSDHERDSSPSTPPSAGSSTSSLTREEASKRLYEGLGMGKPSMHVPPVHVQAKPLSKVLRQPVGPPASVDELGPRNFAARQMKMMVSAIEF